MKDQTSFSIRQVIELTGVSEFTIRGWENRYEAIKPLRTDKGRRLYTTNDVLKIKALKDLVDSGVQISSIAQFKYEDLLEILATHTTPNNHNKKNEEVSKILEFAEKYHWDKVKELLTNQRTNLNHENFIFDLLMPLIAEINILVENAQFSIAKEHILSAIIKEELYSIKNLVRHQKSKSRIILTTPENELHELGILISSAICSINNKNNLYLGPNTPRQQIAEVCLKYNCTHLILSATNTLSKENLLHVLNFLDKQLPENITFCLGGIGFTNILISLKRNTIFFNGLDEVNSFIKNLN